MLPRWDIEHLTDGTGNLTLTALTPTLTNTQAREGGFVKLAAHSWHDGVDT